MCKILERANDCGRSNCTLMSSSEPANALGHILWSFQNSSLHTVSCQSRIGTGRRTSQSRFISDNKICQMSNVYLHTSNNHPSGLKGSGCRSQSPKGKARGDETSGHCISGTLTLDPKCCTASLYFIRCELCEIRRCNHTRTLLENIEHLVKINTGCEVKGPEHP